MCQLWLNLPKRHKMAAPGYQAITAAQIPHVPLSEGDGGMADGYVRVIAGSCNGVGGAATTFTPVEVCCSIHGCRGRTTSRTVSDSVSWEGR